MMTQSTWVEDSYNWTDSSRLKLIFMCLFVLSLILCCDACFVFAVKSFTAFSLFFRFNPDHYSYRISIQIISFSRLNIFLPSLPHSNTTVEFPNHQSYSLIIVGNSDKSNHIRLRPVAPSRRRILTMASWEKTELYKKCWLSRKC